MKTFVLLTTMFCAIWLTPQEHSSVTHSQRTGCPERKTDISGDYAGSIRLGEEDQQDASFTIDGGRFAIKTADGREITGTLSVNTTCNHTAVALRMDRSSGPLEGTVWKGATVSLKAVKGPRFFKLTTADGERLDFTFQCECKKCKDPEACDCCAGKTP